MRKLPLFLNFCCTLILLLLTSTVQSQEIRRSSISSAGNTSSKNGVYLSQSVGQSSVYRTSGNSETELRQGFQQPLELRSGNTSSIIYITLFPNPNQGIFEFATDLSRETSFTFTIVDMQGKLLADGKGQGGTIQQVQLPEGTVSGMYHLYIQTASKLSGSTEIQVIR